MGSHVPSLSLIFSSTNGRQEFKCGGRVPREDASNQLLLEVHPLRGDKGGRGQQSGSSWEQPRGRERGGGRLDG